MTARTPLWEMVDEGWGRKAVDFSTLSEPGNCREYVAMHHRLRGRWRRSSWRRRTRAEKA